MLASIPMNLRATIVTTMKLATAAVALAAGAGCGHTIGKLAVDIPAMPYQSPDIDEITGMDSDAEAGSDSGSGSGSEQK